MNADLFLVDTNVLLYEWDAREPEKQRRAAAWMRHLWQTRTGRVSYQVLTEFYVTATQKLRPGMSPQVARRNVRTLLAWRPVVTDARSLEEAWAAQSRYGLAWWDALILAAGKRAGCRRLLSEDFQDGQSFDGLTVVNPFRVAPPP